MSIQPNKPSKTKPAKTPNVGDLNDYVTLEADLAKANETIAKQRAFIRKLEDEAKSRLALADKSVQWLADFVEQAREYKTIRDYAKECTASNKRLAAQFGSNKESGAYHTPPSVIDANLEHLRTAVRVADNLVSVLWKEIEEARVAAENDAKAGG